MTVSNQYIIKKRQVYYLLFFLLFCCFGQQAKGQSSCNYRPGETINLNISGNNTRANYTQHYILVNSAENIAYSESTPTFTGVAEEKYFAYAVNYDHTQTPPTLTVGTALTAIGGDCVDLSTPLAIGVCDCSNNTGNVTFTSGGFNTDANFTQVYALTDSTYTIISTQTGTTYSNLANGTYNIIAINYDQTQTAPNLSAGTSIFNIGGDCVDISEPLGFVVCLCDIRDADNLTYQCNANNTGGDTEDDFFTISLFANNPNPGASNQYQVLLGGEVLATAMYGATVLLEWQDAAQTMRFLADGTSVYNLTVRDIDDNSCSDSISTMAQFNCSNCPPPICLPIKTTVKRGE